MPAAQQEPAITPQTVDDISAAIEERFRNAPPADPEPEPEPAAATADDPQPPVAPAQPQAAPEIDEYEAGYSTVEHGFLRGKKGPEVEKAFRHAERAKQQAEERANQLERQLRDAAAERAAQAAAPKVAPQPPAEDAPSFDTLLFADPLKARELILADARKYAVEELDRRQQEAAAQARGEASYAAATAARDQIAAAYGVTPKVAQSMLLMAVSTQLEPYVAADPAARVGAWTLADNYIAACKYEFGEPEAAAPSVSVPPPPQEQSDPPGSKRGAPPAPRRTAPDTSLTAEERASRAEIAKELRLSETGTKRFLRAVN